METVIDPVEQFTLSVSSSQGGSVNNEGGTFNSGTRVTITATPNEGFEFTGWSDSSYGDTNPLTINLTSNTNITANFQPIRYTLTVNVVGQGQVSQEVVSADKSTTEYDSGTVIRLESSPNNGWLFSTWSGASTETTETIDLTINETKTVTASFEEIISIIIDPDGISARGVGKWKIKKRSSITSSKETSVSQQKLDDLCEIYEVVFRSDGTFTIISAVGTNSGNYLYTDQSSIYLTQQGQEYARFENVILSESNLIFTLVLGECNYSYKSEKDETYDEATDPITGTISDTTPPVITLNGSSTVELNIGENWTDPGATATDETDGDITNNIIVDGTVDLSTLGTYTLVYSVADAASNLASTTRTVIVSAVASSSIYFENGTCKCPNAILGETATISGTTYTVVDNSTIQTEIDNGNVNLCTTLVTNMAGLFEGKTLFNSTINFWDTENVTTMDNMFKDANSFNQPLGKWDTSNVISMEYMFWEAYEFNQDIGDWNVSKVVNMGWMFDYASNFDQDIGGWDVSNVEVMNNLFAVAGSFNQDLSQWDTSSAINMHDMFYEASSFNQNIGAWNTENVIDMSGMFDGATVFNQDISDWDVSSVTDMRRMFNRASAFNQPIGNWNVSNVENMRYMFSHAVNFNQDIGDWNTSNVTNIGQMFQNATSFDQDIGDWDIRNVTFLEYTFENASVFNQDIGDWNVSKVTNMLGTFNGAESFNQDIGSWDTSNVSDMEGLFRLASQFNQDIGDWNVSNVEEMRLMFQEAENFNQNLSNWCVNNITTEPEAFSSGSPLEESNKPVWGSCPSSITDSTPPVIALNGSSIVRLYVGDSWTDPGATATDDVDGDLTSSISITGTVDTSTVGTYTLTYSVADAASNAASTTRTVIVNQAVISDTTPPVITLNGESTLQLTVGDTWSDPGATATDETDGDLTSAISISGTADTSTIGTYTLVYSVADSASNVASTTRTVIVNQAVTSSIYFENGTCKCPNASVGETATISGTTYTVVDNSTIQGEVNNGNVNLCTTLVNDMSQLFAQKESFNDNISFWDTSNVTSMFGMFSGAYAFNQAIGLWDTSNVTNMESLFFEARAFNQNIGDWNTSNVTTMRAMFTATRSFNQDISGWDVSNVIDMLNMFLGATVFNKDIGGWDVSNVTNMSSMFREASAFNQNLNSWDTSQVTNMSFMFNFASNFNGDISDWDTSQVTNMDNMFEEANQFNQLIDNWDVSSVTSMDGMFAGNNMAFSSVLSDWCVSNIPSKPNNFHSISISETEFLFPGDFHPIWGTCPSSNIDTTPPVITLNGSSTIELTVGDTWSDPGATATDNVDGDLTSSISITGTVDASTVGTYTLTYSVTDAASNSASTTRTVIVNQAVISSIYFENGTCKCPNATAGETATISGTTYTSVDNSTIQGEVDNGNVNLCTTLVTDMTDVFKDKSSFNSDISFWDTSNVTLMNSMFADATNFNQDISGWDVSSVTNMSYMFYQATAFDQDIGNWDVSNVTNMYYLFAGAGNFNQNLNSWDVSNVTDMYFLFHSATAFNQDISSWDVSNVTDMGGMFYNANSFNQDISGWNVTSVINMTRMFRAAHSFNSDISNWDISNVTDLTEMFRNADAFNRSINTWDVSSVTNMSGMFRGTSVFNQSLSTWDVSSVTNMDDMFHNANSFNQDLSGWCVNNIPSNPLNFSANSALTNQNKPVWGTCPGDNRWEGSRITFTKADSADPTDESNQDRITDNVWITRANSGGQIFNIVSETSATSDSSPAGTEWAQGSFDDIDTLTFTSFRNACPNQKPKDVVGVPMVLHLTAEDIYIEVEFTSWSQGKQGGFSYQRTTQD